MAEKDIRNLIKLLDNDEKGLMQAMHDKQNDLIGRYLNQVEDIKAKLRANLLDPNAHLSDILKKTIALRLQLSEDIGYNEGRKIAYEPNLQSAQHQRPIAIEMLKPEKQANVEKGAENQNTSSAELRKQMQQKQVALETNRKAANPVEPKAKSSEEEPKPQQDDTKPSNRGT